MAGPAASILTPAMGSTLNADLLRAISAGAMPRRTRAVDLYISDTRGIGGDYVGEGRPFSFELQRAGLARVDVAAIIEQFGFKPRGEFAICAMCGTHEDHRILGTVALHLARAHSGIVDFGGALLPPYWRGLRQLEKSWQEVEKDFDAWVGSIPGKIVCLPYETAEGRTWVRHVVDTKFLANWLQRQDFHMVK